MAMEDDPMARFEVTNAIADENARRIRGVRAA